MSEGHHVHSRLEVASVVAFYMAAALVMVFVNKAVLNSSPGLPFTFLFSQTIIAIILLQCASKLCPRRFHLDPLTLAETKHVAPLVFVGLAGLIFNTFCLRDVDTTFFQIARGLVLPMTILASAIWTRRTPRGAVLIASTVVTIGFTVGVSPSAAFNTNPLQNVASMGLLYGLLSSLLAAVHAVMRKTHVGREITIVQLAYNNNLLGSILLVPLIVFNGELSGFRDMLLNRQQLAVFIVGGSVTGLFGLFLSLAGLLSIKITSPVTHMFSSAARSVIQTTLGVLIFGDILTLNRLASLAVIAIGTLYFTWTQNSLVPPAPRPMTGKSSGDLEKQ